MMKNGMMIGAILFVWIILHATITCSQDRNTAKTRVIFVCEHGGARSTIASLYFNRMMKENNLPYESVFRANVPDSTISKETRKGLTGDGFDTRGLVPVALTASDVSPDAILIAMDCKVNSFQPSQEWTGIPTISQDYQSARNEIIKKLNVLMNELKNKK
jgi:protein-tyrosine-phosphatase